MLFGKQVRIYKVWLASVIAILCVLISGCQAQPPEKGDFTCDLPKGFTISDVTDKDCAILNSDGVVVGGMILTDLRVKALTDEDSVALPQYLEAIAEGSEYFAWKDGDKNHPIRYMNHYFTDPNTQERKEYDRVFFVKDAGVYDMWFDMERIDEDTISGFLPIAETK